MKKTILFCVAMLLSVFCFAQVVVYKNSEEFKNGKPSLSGEHLRCETVFGKYVFTLINGKTKQKLDSKNFWGYKQNDTDYRIIDGKPHAIATRGAIYLYSGASDYIETTGTEVIYNKHGNAYSYASKGLDEVPHVVHNFNDLVKMMDPGKATAIKQIAAKEKGDVKGRGFEITGPGGGATGFQNVQLSGFLEDIADYYNSISANYLSKRITKIKYTYSESGNY